MTEEYKNTLLRYFTGNLDFSWGTNEPQFIEKTSSDSTIYSYIETNAGSGFTILGTLQGINSTNLVIYGNKSNNKGFIVILNENNTPIQYIEEYASGTAFGEFKILNVAEDGNFYGVDVNNSTPRFIMLNNITLVLPNQSEFSVKLRQSYNLPSPLSTATSYFAITKAVGQGKYLFGATTTSNNIASPLVTELTINVGATNDWVNYQLPLQNLSSFTGCSMWASWNEDVLDFKINGYGSSTNEVYYWEYTKGTGTTLESEPYPTSITTDYDYSINAILVTKNKAYLGIYNGGEYGTDEINWILEFENGEYTNYWSFQKGTQLPYTGIDRKVQFKVVNGNVYFMCKCYEQYSGVNDLYIYYGIIVPGDFYSNMYYDEIFIDDGTTWRYELVISNIYNLYTYNILSYDYEDHTPLGSNYSIKQVYNKNNYNGLPYEQRWSLIPHTGELYDDDNNLVFARNLYNNTVTNNTTLSVLQVPNTLLNNITIAQQVLLGETNKILTTNLEDVTKNIYETMYFNFYNTMMIQNRNTPIYIDNMNGAMRINSSVSNTIDYDTAKATKYRVNYSDNSSMVNPITPTIQETDSASGNNSLYITNAKQQDNVISYNVEGSTSQDGTPTPDNPVEVETIPSVINMFNVNNIQEGYYINTTTGVPRTNSAWNTSYLIKANPSTSYTLSNSGSLGQLMIAQYKANEQTQTNFITYQQTSTGSTNKLTITTDSQCQYIVIGYRNDKGQTNIMLEQSDTLHEYVPYGYWSKVKVTGKNMFDKNNTQWYRNNGGAFVSTANTNTTRIRTNSFEIEGGKTYTLSGIPEDISFLLVSEYNEYGGTRASYIYPENNSFTLAQSTKYVNFIFGGSNFTDDTNTLMANANIQLEEGTQATPYEEYKENITLIDMSKPNLFDKDTMYISGKNLDNSKNINSGGNGIGIVPCKPNTTYTLKKLETNANRVGYSSSYQTTGTIDYVTTISNTSTVTFTTNSTAQYIYINIMADSDITIRGYTLQQMLSSLKIYESNNPTPYYELCKTYNYKDILSINDNSNCVIYKNVGKVVFNGNEGWTRMANTGAGEGTYLFYTPKPTNVLSGTINLYSNYFIASNTYGSTDNCVYIGNSNLIISRVKTNGVYIETTSDFKTWLSTHNTEVYYPLSAPEIITLQNTRLPLFEGINHITFVDTLTTYTQIAYDIVNKGIYDIQVYVPTDKTISNIEIISEDENTTYQTIDTSSLENNKYYDIRQECHVE